MEVTADFSKQMMLRVVIYEGGYCHASIYDKQVFEQGIPWDDELTSRIRIGSRVTMNGHSYEVTGFELQTSRVDDPDVTYKYGLDSSQIGEAFPNNMILTIQVKEV